MRIISHGGLLFVAQPLDCPEADEIAIANRLRCAERMVEHVASLGGMVEVDPIGKITRIFSSPYNELEQFKAFFKLMGVTYTEWDASDDFKEHGEDRVLSVAQAHFKFDDCGKYIGAQDDEMGNWYPKEMIK